MLVGATPRFVADDDWPHAMTAETLARFGDELAVSWRHTLQRFLALQVHGSDHGRAALHALRHELFARGEPAPAVLRDGLALLGRLDLRAQVPAIAAPTLVVAGGRDALTPPGAGRWLAAALPDARTASRSPAPRTYRSCRIPTNSTPPSTHSSMAADDTPGPNRVAGAGPDARPARGAPHFGRAAATYDAAAVLQKEVGARMMERLDVVRLAPARVLDLGCGTGDALGELAVRYPQAQRVAVDIALPMLERARAKTGERRGALARLASALGAGWGRTAPPRAGVRRRRHGGAAAGAGDVRAGVEQPRAAVAERSGTGVRRGASRARGRRRCSRSRPSAPTRCASCAPRSPPSTVTRTCRGSSTCTTSATRWCTPASPTR